MKNKEMKNITYINPDGMEFIFIEDIQRYLGKRKFNKFEKLSRGSTRLLLPSNGIGVYPRDFRKFIRLDNLGK